MVGTFLHAVNGVVIIGITGLAIIAQPVKPGAARDEAAVSAAFSDVAADRFTVIDHRAGETCVIAIHRAEGYGARRVEPGDCGAVNGGLVAARTWQDTAAGDVRITDSDGNTLMKLAASDGFAWEVMEPRNVALSFEAR
ncbi:hypothetical protein [Oricola cellulosilytica]|uniref:Alkaline proteinase inhibitor/ Outer membrane lipoprotein Omp19 domain-containing protein n=1 Tax=Oricola cellulosilytica TaxID=1429082 RepID=A0A4R0P761_9HYPH|nr:hypothetical protein [Oricola cellulosilytica]TCD11349.1 hypothetical protein E0D97_16710 [Oricola cellulosilytica]